MYRIELNKQVVAYTDSLKEAKEIKKEITSLGAVKIKKGF